MGQIDDFPVIIMCVSCFTRVTKKQKLAACYFQSDLEIGSRAMESGMVSHGIISTTITRSFKVYNYYIYSSHENCDGRILLWTLDIHHYTDSHFYHLSLKRNNRKKKEKKKKDLFTDSSGSE